MNSIITDKNELKICIDLNELLELEALVGTNQIDRFCDLLKTRIEEYYNIFKKEKDLKLIKSKVVDGLKKVYKIKSDIKEK